MDVKSNRQIEQVYLVMMISRTQIFSFVMYCVIMSNQKAKSGVRLELHLNSRVKVN